MTPMSDTAIVGHMAMPTALSKTSVMTFWPSPGISEATSLNCRPPVSTSSTLARVSAGGSLRMDWSWSRALLWKTAVPTATPSEPPIIDAALKTPETTPSPASPGSSTAVAAHGVICRPMPTPMRMKGAINCVYEPDRSRSRKAATARQAMPIAVGHAGPNRRPSQVPSGLMMRIGIVAGSSRRPAWSGS